MADVTPKKSKVPSPRVKKKKSKPKMKDSNDGLPSPQAAGEEVEGSSPLSPDNDQVSKRRSWLRHSWKDRRGAANRGSHDENDTSGESKKKEHKDKEKKDKDGHKPVIMAEDICQKQRQLESFLLSCAVKKLAGTTWKYFDLGERANETMLLLHAGGVRPEAHFEMMMAFVEERYRVIAPWMPTEFIELEDYVEGVFHCFDITHLPHATSHHTHKLTHLLHAHII